MAADEWNVHLLRTLATSCFSCTVQLSRCLLQSTVSVHLDYVQLVVSVADTPVMLGLTRRHVAATRRSFVATAVVVRDDTVHRHRRRPSAQIVTHSRKGSC